MTMTTRRQIGVLSLALFLGSATAAMAQREARDLESTITEPSPLMVSLHGSPEGFADFQL